MENEANFLRQLLPNFPSQKGNPMPHFPFTEDDFALPKLPAQQCYAGQGGATTALQKMAVFPSPFGAILYTLSCRKAFQPLTLLP